MNGPSFDTPPPPESLLPELPLDEFDDELSLDEALPPPADYEPAEPSLDDIDNATIVQIVDSDYTRAKDARSERQRLNDRNWNAVNRKFDFLARKQAGQSKVVLPSLQMSLEQIANTLASQVVGSDVWFSLDYEGDPPLDIMPTPEESAKLLARELKRLWKPGNEVNSARSIGSVMYDAFKIGLIESEIVLKVSADEEETFVYQLSDERADGQRRVVQRIPKKTWRLKVEVVPFADFYPDPSPANRFVIHEVEADVADLKSFGFSDEQVAAIKGHTTTEKDEQRRVRSGVTGSTPSNPHRVVLRERWGDLISPQTGELLAKNTRVLTCGNAVLKEYNPLWAGKRPFVRISLLTTPLSNTHQAFVDIAATLVELESELTNLVIDGGFGAVHGIKEVREYMAENPEVMANGIVPGIEISVLEEFANDQNPVVKRTDTGDLPAEVFNVLDRIGRIRQEAFAISDLQLGRLPPRKESATAITEAQEGSNDLFSAMAGRAEDNGVEGLLELAWLTMWQYLDAVDPSSLAGVMPPEKAALLSQLTDEERFVLLANGVHFKVEGFKHQLGAVKNFQKLLTLQDAASRNPATFALYQQEFSPIKAFRLMYRALGIDPTELKRGPEEPFVDPALVNGGGGVNPDVASANETATPPNPTGERGNQLI